MSSSVVALETKAARVSLARSVHSRTHSFLETPVSSCVQVSFVNCPQPRSISNSPAFLGCMFCFPIADHAMLPQRTISFKCRSWWFCRWLWPSWRLIHTDELSLIPRAPRLYLWLKDFRSYHAQGRYDVKNYFLSSCRRRGPKGLVIDFLFIVWVKNRIWVCTCFKWFISHYPFRHWLSTADSNPERWRLLNNVLYGEAPPRGPTLHPFQLYRPFLKEKVPFLILVLLAVYDKRYPFHIPSLLNMVRIPFNCRELTDFLIWTRTLLVALSLACLEMSSNVKGPGAVILLFRLGYKKKILILLHWGVPFQGFYTRKIERWFLSVSGA